MRTFSEISSGVRTGERDAQSDLVSRIRPELLRLARHLGSTHPESSIQDALDYGITIVTSFDSVDEPTLLSSLRRIVRDGVRRVADTDTSLYGVDSTSDMHKMWEQSFKDFISRHDSADPTSLHYSEDFHIEGWSDRSKFCPKSSRPQQRRGTKTRDPIEFR